MAKRSNDRLQDGWNVTGWLFGWRTNWTNVSTKVAQLKPVRLELWPLLPDWQHEAELFEPFLPRCFHSPDGHRSQSLHLVLGLASAIVAWKPGWPLRFHGSSSARKALRFHAGSCALWSVILWSQGFTIASFSLKTKSSRRRILTRFFKRLRRQHGRDWTWRMRKP